ncbi:MAG: phage protein Gp37 [Sodalis sp. (in: enterobacteria)]|uniref:phage protein Gp37 n=1 Tax=Sodalis sp. (in: enterobacteria) TaxID=1898979 RepID=UPI0039E4F8F4
MLPGRVRSLFSTRLNSDALAAYACEFDTVWVEEALDNGRWPAPESDNDPDRLFADYQGRLDRPWPMHERTGLAYHLEGQPTVASQDIVTTRAKDHD